LRCIARPRVCVFGFGLVSFVRNSKLGGNSRTLTAGLDRLREFYWRGERRRDRRSRRNSRDESSSEENPDLEARGSWIDSSRAKIVHPASPRTSPPPPLRSPHRSRAARLVKLVADESRHSRGVGDYGRFAPGDKSRGNLDSARRLRQLRNLPIDLYRSIILQRSIVDPRACESRASQETIRRESPRRKGRSGEIRRRISQVTRLNVSRSEIHSRAGE